MNSLQKLLQSREPDRPVGVFSCCSAHPVVLDAVLAYAAKHGCVALIEATANQVNQYGGYTGMRPSDFAVFVREHADKFDLPHRQLILGGDHLGPLTFAHLPEPQAMAEASALVREYVLAGFTKIHLDTSMKLSGNPAGPLSDEIIARRGAALCRVCEDAFAERMRLAADAEPPVYVIGSEVPIPGGTQEEEGRPAVTEPQAVKQTIEHYLRAFSKAGLKGVWPRVIALVAQPGVEFGDDVVYEYDRQEAALLSKALSGTSLVFEAHSTDYQPPQALQQMVEDGFAVLKVGPALTFALREGLFALESIEKEIAELHSFEPSCLRKTLLEEMLRDDSQWKKHYHGSETDKRFKCLFSLSDRARYYLASVSVQAACDKLMSNLEKYGIPMTLISQYLPQQYDEIQSGKLGSSAWELISSKVTHCIDSYGKAVL